MFRFGRPRRGARMWHPLFAPPRPGPLAASAATPPPGPALPDRSWMISGAQMETARSIPVWAASRCAVAILFRSGGGIAP